MKKKIFIGITIILTMLIIAGTKSFALTIVLDPGHGGTDGGATATNGEREKDLTMKVANYLKEYLEPYDVDVYLTHTSANDTMDVFARGMFIRNKKADLGVSLHFNSAPTTNLNGVEVYVTNDKSLPKYNKNSTELANKIISNITALGISNRGVKTRLSTGDSTDVYSDGTISDYYGVIRYSMRGCKIDWGKITPAGAKPANVQNGEGVPTILIEHCFLIGSDYKYINSESKLKKLAEADGKAIVDYYKIPLKKIREKLEPFDDVYVDDWYAKCVKYVYDNNMIKGYNETKFAPKDKLSRAMLVTILWRMEGSPKTNLNKFPDVNAENWYYQAVNWAASKRIIHGYQTGNFGPKDNITREQLAAILMNYAKYKGKNVSARANTSKFTDFNTTSSAFKDAVSWCVANKIISGKENGTKVDSKGTASRAEAASMLMSYCLNVK